MHQTKLLLCALLSWAGAIFVGELSAQQAARRSPAGVSVNNGQAVLPLGQSARLGMTRQRPTISDSPFVAVFGAVKTPAVFETTELSVPLQTLIERAGGETSESIGSVRIMEHAATRFKPNQSSKLNLQIARGQVVFVVPRGGRTAQVFDPRRPAPDKIVLITGLKSQPLLFNIGNQPRAFGELLIKLGQSEDLMAKGQVAGTLPQGTLMDLESQLAHHVGIHFEPEAVNQKGFQRAVEDGFSSEPLVQLEGPRTASPASPTPIVPILNPVRPTPVIEREPTPIRITPASPVTSDLSSVPEGTGIEPAGSSIQFDEPMPFPSSETDEDDEDMLEETHRQSNGIVPLMMPKTWQYQGKSPEGEVEDPVQTINRTSAGQLHRSTHIRTASAEFEQMSPPKLDMEPELLALEAPSGVPTVKSSTYSGPQSWFALLVTIGIAALSLVVSRHIGRERFSSPQVEAVTKKSDHLTSATEATTVTSQEDEQRFLQRLIMNKVPLLEEESTLPSIDRLHGTAIGGRRLVINDAHENLAGPHFKVREPRDTRAVELRLRQLMRTGSNSSRQTVSVGTTTDPRESHVSKVSPLERALRNVERGDTP